LQLNLFDQTAEAEALLDGNFLQRLNSHFPWPAIAGIGNSPPARLTALAPLIGYLVIYNQFIADFFFLSESGSATRLGPATILDLLSDARLTFLYFGLVFFGIGAILFALLAPKSIRKYKTPEEYVLAMEAVQTEWLKGADLPFAALWSKATLGRCIAAPANRFARCTAHQSR
jgi:hypothetical protein